MTYYEEDQPDLDALPRRKYAAEVEPESEGKFIEDMTDDEFTDHVRNVMKSSDSPEVGIMKVKGSTEQHEEMMEMLGGMFVQLSRIYDVLMLTLPDEIRRELSAEHEKGKLIGDAPALAEDAWS